jgi:hypothetical protein
MWTSLLADRWYHRDRLALCMPCVLRDLESTFIGRRLRSWMRRQRVA